MKKLIFYIILLVVSFSAPSCASYQSGLSLNKTYKMPMYKFKCKNGQCYRF